ncbi:ATP-binding protein [Streptomyces sp. NPDC046727]|uniref:ATP-binding protein n=1 Tax=Streptomyces sp. NPDC046727 TaxID=3155373 RepID=UPI003400CBF7
MDLRSSPYSPGAGTRPAVFVGRGSILDRFDVALDRLEAGRSDDAPLITGARGSGKTVLFNLMVERARERGWFVGAEEAIPGTQMSALIALMARDVLLEMSTRHRFTDRVRRALGILKAFASVSVAGLRLDINAEAVTGTADTGIIELDLRRLVLEIGEIARLQGIGVLFALDEVHIIPNEDLYALNAALHAAAQRALPVSFLGSGLFPSWQATGAEMADPTMVTSYISRAETLSYERLEPLTAADSRRALTEPAAGEGVRFSNEALAAAVDFCEGSPWLLQAVGAVAWGHAPGSPIDQATMGITLIDVQNRLNRMFFPRLLRSCSEPERRVLASVAAADGHRLHVESLYELLPDVERPRHVIRRLANQNLIDLHYQHFPIEYGEFDISLAVPRLAAFCGPAGPPSTHPR